nr:Os05g0279850 [Ipomoea batatas]
MPSSKQSIGGDGVAAGEVNRRAPDVVGALDVAEGDVGDVDGGGLVPALLAEAVVLVDDDAVAHVFHLDGVEADSGDGARAALPRLDPQPVVGVFYHGVRYGPHVTASISTLAHPGPIEMQSSPVEITRRLLFDILESISYEQLKLSFVSGLHIKFYLVYTLRVVDFDMFGVLNVNAIGVGAKLGGVDGQFMDFYALATIEFDVELRTVLDA